MTATTALAFVYGALVGSFLNVVIYRLPNDLSVVRPRSRCPKCETPIPAWLNVPILSWILLRGRCYTCRAPISIRYPTIELLTGVLWAASVVRYGVSWAGLAACVLASMLVAITFIDLDHWEIPDEISLPGIAIGLLARPLAFGAPWYDGIAGALVGAGVLWLIRALASWWKGVEAMGLGDLKLLAMTGAFLGLGSILPTLLVGSVFGTLIGALALLARRIQRGPAPPAPDSTPPLAPPSAEDVRAPEETPATDTPLASQETAPPPTDAPAQPPSAPDERDEDEDDDWVPPATAVPFGPFLALGALAHLLMAPAIDRAMLIVGRITAPLFAPLAELILRLTGTSGE